MPLNGVYHKKTMLYTALFRIALIAPYPVTGVKNFLTACILIARAIVVITKRWPELK